MTDRTAIVHSMLRTTGLILVGILTTAAGGSIDVPPRPNPAFLGTAGPLPGYLAKGEHPDSSMLLQPPPAAGSVAFALDEELNLEFLKLRGSARWKLAAEDAKTRFPDAAGTFSCALGVPITEQDTPSAYIILRRSVIDVGMSVRPAKKRYQRARPFVVNEQPVCTPTALKYLKKDGSYPSGHTTAGWAWALILAEIAPDRTDAVLARGWEFGQSRAVCNVHWQSDVTQGRVIGAAVVARLHANADFRADLELAREEVAAVRAKGLLPDRDCEAETNALAVDVPYAL
jgi:acid phosphatase (class A)